MRVRYSFHLISDFDDICVFVDRYSSVSYPPIKALFLNAGLQCLGGVEYTEGIEKTFAINHVGGALLFCLLRPHFAKDARIVLTASGVHDPAQKTGIPDAKYASAEELVHPTLQRQRITVVSDIPSVNCAMLCGHRRCIADSPKIQHQS